MLRPEVGVVFGDVVHTGPGGGPRPDLGWSIVPASGYSRGELANTTSDLFSVHTIDS
jgi:hypothetical protein